MRIKIIKIILSLLFLTVPITCFTHTAHAMSDCILVSVYKIDLSPASLLNSDYLNSPKIKQYLMERIELSEVLDPEYVEELKVKLDYVSFFCLTTDLYNDKGQAILKIWVPANITIKKSPGVLHTIFVDYPLLKKHCTI